MTTQKRRSPIKFNYVLTEQDKMQEWIKLEDWTEIPTATTGCYRLTCYDDKKSMYIGKARNIKKRWSTYSRRSCKGQPKLFNYLCKYLNFSKWTFEYMPLEEEKYGAMEHYLIKKHNTIMPNGLNLTVGGDGGSFTKSKEAIQRRIESTKKAHTKTYILFNTFTKEKVEIKGSIAMRNFYGLKCKTSIISNLYSSLIYYNSLWRVLKDNEIVVPTYMGTKVSVFKPKSNIKIEKGHTPWNKGRKETRPEVIAKYGVSKKGKKLSPESIAKREATRIARGTGKGCPKKPESIAKWVASRKANRERKLLEEQNGKEIR